MEYYTEYFNDAGVEKESEVCNKLGSPNELANKIIAELRGNNHMILILLLRKVIYLQDGLLPLLF